MIASVVIFTAMVLFVMVATPAVYQSVLEVRLKYIDELMKRGAKLTDVLHDED